jgi:hypothetical protein
MLHQQNSVVTTHCRKTASKHLFIATAYSNFVWKNSRRVEKIGDLRFPLSNPKFEPKRKAKQLIDQQRKEV